MSRSHHQPSAPWRHIDDWRCVPASVKRRLQPADSSPEDVPTPEEIDPSLIGLDDCPNGCRDCIGAICNARGYLDLFGAVRAL